MPILCFSIASSVLGAKPVSFANFAAFRGCRPGSSRTLVCFFFENERKNKKKTGDRKHLAIYSA
jgi:hypothetical protein